MIVDVAPKTLITYESRDGKRPFEKWLYSLKDPQTIARIIARLNRVAAGNLGDVKSVGEGVSELRLKFGKGYRVYFGQVGKEIILLLCGGDKSSQGKDIATAKEYWNEYKRKEHV